MLNSSQCGATIAPIDMKKSAVALLFVFAFLLAPQIALASPGGLDKNGGHRCRKSVSYCAKYGLKINQYHCHRAYCKLHK